MCFTFVLFHDDRYVRQRVLPCDGTTSGHAWKNNSKFEGPCPRHQRRFSVDAGGQCSMRLATFGIGNRSSRPIQRLDQRPLKQMYAERLSKERGAVLLAAVREPKSFSETNQRFLSSIVSTRKASVSP